MKGLVWGRTRTGPLETTKPKLVTAGIWRRGQWDIIRFGRDKWEPEVQVIKDSVMDGGEMLEFELDVLGTVGTVLSLGAYVGLVVLMMDSPTLAYVGLY